MSVSFDHYIKKKQFNIELANSALIYSMRTVRPVRGQSAGQREMILRPILPPYERYTYIVCGRDIYCARRARGELWKATIRHEVHPVF